MARENIGELITICQSFLPISSMHTVSPCSCDLPHAFSSKNSSSDSALHNKYFHPKASKLDEERFPLSKVVPSSEITAINSSVKDEKKRSVRAPYLILTPAQRYELGRRAAEHGVTLTIHYYAPDLDLKETSVQRFKNSYQA